MLDSDASFDALIVDLGADLQASTNAIQAIRAAGHNTISITAIGPYSNSEVENASFAAGANNYLSKPLSAKALALTLQDIAAISTPRRPTAPPSPPELLVAPSKAAFKRDEVLEQIGGDPGLFHEVAGLFLRDLPQLKQELADSLAGPPEVVFSEPIPLGEPAKNFAGA